MLFVDCEKFLASTENLFIFWSQTWIKAFIGDFKWEKVLLIKCYLFCFNLQSNVGEEIQENRLCEEACLQDSGAG